MPTADSVLSWATAVANDWRWLAMAWHVALAALLMAVAVTVRLSQRLIGVLLVLPLVSVSVVAWVSGNPFNGLVFAVLALLLLHAATHLPQLPRRRAAAGWVLAGVALVAFGWTYPHFLETNTWTAYLYASPFGLLPCPTLSVVIGVSLIVGGLRSSWSVPLAAAGIVYGVIGVITLGVSLDVWLLLGASALGAMLLANLLGARVRADDDERTRRLAGDELIPSPVGTLTHAITIDGSQAAVWPWIIQMGAGRRAGWYSYDFLDNGGRASAARIVPELEQVTVGTIFPALPGVSDGFVVLRLEAERVLVLGWPDPDGSPTVTWAFVLERMSGTTTRLIVRVRAGQGYRFHDLPVWLSEPAIRLVHFVMQRKQLLGIARRVESANAALPKVA